jgi:uncharacterized protein (DUF2132 family)
MPTHDANGRPIRELHGVKLADILEYLVAKVGFPALAEKVPIRCFAYDPSISSSLVFLRRTPWARAKVEALYVELRLAE